MATTTSAQDLYDPTGGCAGTYRVLDAVDDALDANGQRRLRGRLQRVLPYFPELNAATVTVAVHPEAQHAYAVADWHNDIIFLPVHELCPHLTIAHELSHLAIKRRSDRGEDVPVTSEEFCSIFAVARLPHTLLDRTTIAYLGEPSRPRRQWPAVCQRALEYRTDHRNYIQQCKQWLGV